jgi:hypothetical protein
LQKGGSFDDKTTCPLALPWNFQDGYDNIGQLTSALEKESRGVTNRFQEMFSYTYDKAGNLSVSNGANTFTAIAQDALGGRTRMDKIGDGGSTPKRNASFR